MSLGRVAGVLASAALLAASAAPSAWADGSLTDVSDAGSFPDRVWTLQLDGKKPVEAAGVRVREDDGSVRDLQVTALASASDAKAFGTILVIDASGSMKGRPIKDAMAAARAFAARRQPRQSLGVILFNRNTEVVLPPTTDVAKITAALQNTPTLHGGTHMNDAVGAAVDVLHTTGIRAGSVIVLSDGSDNGSRVSDAQVIQAARRTGTRIFTVGLESGVFNPNELLRLAERTGGTMAAAGSSSGLKGIFEELGTRLSSGFMITYRSVRPGGERVRVDVDVDGDEQPDATAAYIAPIPGAARPADADDNAFWASTTAVGVVTSTFALLVGIALAAALWRPKQEQLLERISQYSPDLLNRRGQPSAAPLTGVTALFERLLSATRWWERFAEVVDVARTKQTAAQLALYTSLGTLALLGLAGLTGSAVVGVLALLPPIGLTVFLRIKAGRERKKFGEQLADNLQVFASAMRAGHSFTGALGTVIDDAPEPTRREFQRALTDERLGTPIDDALSGIGRRMKNRQMNQVAMIAALQQETGGNTAEVLDRVVDAVRERQELMRLVRSLTAQGRISQVVVTLLPFGVAGIVSFLNPGYLNPMLESQTGRIAIAVGVAMVAMGSFAIKRIVDIKV